MATSAPTVGEPDRFEHLYREHFRFVWGAVKRLGVAQHALEDAVQDVFTTAYRKLDTIEFEASPRAWLWGVTRRVAFRHRRTDARIHRRRAAVAAANRDGVDPSDRHHAARWVDRFLGTLDPPQRDAFIMAELLGMTASEIAADQGVSINTVYSRLRLARRNLLRVAQSPEHARMLVTETRRDAAPPPQQRVRSWAALLPLVRAPDLVPVVGSIGAWLLGGTLAAAGLAAVAMGTTPAPSSPAELGPVTQRPAAVAAAAIVSADVPAPTPPEVVVAQAPAPVSSVSPRAASRPSASQHDTALARELRLIEAAQAALNRGDAPRALGLVGQHARQFSDGQLVDVRMATRVRALCALDRVAEANLERDQLHRAYPNSNVARVENARCR